MKLKATALILGICLSLLTVSGSAFARSVAAFGTAQVQQSKVNQYGSNNPRTCLTEYWGELVNRCNYEVAVVFELPIDTDGSHLVTVQNLSFGSTSSFKCSVNGFTGDGPTGDDTQTLVMFGPGNSSGASVNVNPGGTIQVNCYIPGIVGGEPNGLADINWQP